MGVNMLERFEAKTNLNDGQWSHAWRASHPSYVEDGKPDAIYVAKSVGAVGVTVEFDAAQIVHLANTLLTDTERAGIRSRLGDAIARAQSAGEVVEVAELRAQVARG